ncbi:DUF2909 domain-containing protein [Thalassotalea sp. 1_MG-2023]|uniref:DUF2909 domain-containing protein n=1 Tax=Thalassotalea sp. 1_MG-2023 TaxID=3062680 RepID=UPI0026E3A117|nr:DUF2909 domain-containing protein [Thalassotalea sp. 1_MG-2023]MDO6425437.1 DUF2909 domain-containing protein [Thalassotalea sp. 1_MG-2023]
MIIKVIIIGLLIYMIYNLFQALRLMSKNDPNKPSMSKFIGRRVMTSVVIVLLLLIGVLTGVITPNPRPY